MIGLFNNDTSFFDIKTGRSVTDRQLVNAINDQIMSFSLTEEMNKIFNGSITLFDPYHNALDMVLYPGSQLKISWGYKRPDSSLMAAFASKDNPGELNGPFSRTGALAYVTNPSGEGSAEGVITYNCSFMGSEVYSGIKSKIYSGCQKFIVVQEVLTRMGIKKQNQLINFGRQSEFLDQDTALIQWESNFQFLNRLAFEQRTNFSVCHGRTGPVAVFADFNTTQMDRFCNMVGSSVGTSLTLNYKWGVSNVESYSFQCSVGDSAGDNVQIFYMNGQPQFRRYKAQEQKVVDYAINTEKIKSELASKPGMSKVTYAAELMKINRFDVLVQKGYFYPVTSTTAPQGYGWSFKVRMLGNPMMTAPMRVRMGNGFPNIFRPDANSGVSSGLGASQDAGAGSGTSTALAGFGAGGGGKTASPKTSLWVRSVTHTVDENGYHMELDIVDALTLTGGSYVG